VSAIPEYNPDWSSQAGIQPEWVRIDAMLVLDLPEWQSAFLWGPRKTGTDVLPWRVFLDRLWGNELI
jgi:hypothetical protein